MRSLFLLLALSALAIACSNEAGDGGDGAAADSTYRGDSGLVLKHVTVGSGDSPGETDTVVVHYHGTFPDGTVFDSSVDRGTPATFPLNRVIPCWTEGLQQIQVGGKAQLTCPPEIAYGPRGMPGAIPPNATLHFEVELLGIK
jgi:FKBP-type peptidyl-prolyl cis-trans isomerase FkpA